MFPPLNKMGLAFLDECEAWRSPKKDISLVKPAAWIARRKFRNGGRALLTHRQCGRSGRDSGVTGAVAMENLGTTVPRQRRLLYVGEDTHTSQVLAQRNPTRLERSGRDLTPGQRMDRWGHPRTSSPCDAYRDYYGRGLNCSGGRGMRGRTLPYGPRRAM